MKIILKLKTVCHCTGKCKGGAHNICNLKYSIPKEVSVLFHNGWKYDYHFIIKELAKEFGGEFVCLGENTEKYKTSPVPITKEVKRIGKNGEETTKPISYKLQFIDSARFMASLLSNLLDNLAEGIHKTKCTPGHDNKKSETCGSTYKDCEYCLE